MKMAQRMNIEWNKAVRRVIALAWREHPTQTGGGGGGRLGVIVLAWREHPTQTGGVCVWGGRLGVIVLAWREVVRYSLYPP